MNRAERRRRAREDARKPSLISTGTTIKVDGSRFEKVDQ